METRPVRLVRSFLILAFVFVMIGCQTPPHRRFERVQEGMDKARVLDVIGSPKTSYRWQEKDRWIYHFDVPGEGLRTREIHFDQGRAVYVGPRPSPEISAEEQDKINQAVNAQEREREASLKAHRDKKLGVARPYLLNESPDERDLTLYDSLYGTEFREERQIDKVKRAPEFESVD